MLSVERFEDYAERGKNEKIVEQMKKKIQPLIDEYNKVRTDE